MTTTLKHIKTVLKVPYSLELPSLEKKNNKHILGGNEEMRKWDTEYKSLMENFWQCSVVVHIHLFDSSKCIVL